jgi:hypothetical protein
VAAVRAQIEQSPRHSAQKHVDALQLSDQSVRRILHRNLKMHPYKIAIAQELSERDCETRTTSCWGLLQNVPSTAVLLFMDDAHFHLSGTVNKQNFQYWSNNNPRELRQRPLHSHKVTVWGPYFFEEDDVTVTSNRYCAMLENFLQPKLDELFGEHEAVKCVVSTGWCNSPHISSFARNSQRNHSWACCLLAR